MFIQRFNCDLLNKLGCSAGGGGVQLLADVVVDTATDLVSITGLNIVEGDFILIHTRAKSTLTPYQSDWLKMYINGDYTDTNYRTNMRHFSGVVQDFVYSECRLGYDYSSIFNFFSIELIPLPDGAEWHCRSSEYGASSTDAFYTQGRHNGSDSPITQLEFGFGQGQVDVGTWIKIYKLNP